MSNNTPPIPLLPPSHSSPIIKKIQIMSDFIVIGQNDEFMDTAARLDPEPIFLALDPGSFASKDSSLSCFYVTPQLPMQSSQPFLFTSSYSKLSSSLPHLALEEDDGLYGTSFFNLSPGFHLRVFHKFSHKSAYFSSSLSRLANVCKIFAMAFIVLQLKQVRPH